MSTSNRALFRVCHTARFLDLCTVSSPRLLYWIVPISRLHICMVCMTIHALIRLRAPIVPHE